MSKFKKSLVSKIQEQRVEEKKQSELKTKHGIETSENVVVVEKSNIIKFLISTGGMLLRRAAQIVILILATIGLMTVIYPELRVPFLKLIQFIKMEVISFFV